MNFNLCDLNEKTLVKLFLRSAKSFWKRNKDYVCHPMSISERCLCGNLAIELYKVFSDYSLAEENIYFDVEYNRQGTDKKTFEGNPIFSDLIVHQRGDDYLNLIYIEMKKDINHDKNQDEDRVAKKTLEGNGNDYRLGVYVLIDTLNKLCMECNFYNKGKIFKNIAIGGKNNEQN